MTEQYCVHCMEAMADGRCTACGRGASAYQPLPHHLLPGTVLNGRYVIGRALGEGGFGITYIGFDTNLEVKVAVKEYYPYGIVNRNNTFSNEVTTNVNTVSEAYEKGKAKFHEEARMLARFSDLPNIVAVKDFFPLNNTEYIVMEYLEGIDLREHIDRVGRMSFEQVFALIDPIMTCLSKVHQKNLIHRDISPSNIMMLKSGRVKLLDFGAARSSNVSDEKSLSVMLKPGFAPYEQYSSKGVQGPWTDVYALAATMYKMLTAETPETATDRVLSDELKSLRALNPSVSEAQERVITKAMSILKQDRYQTMEEFRRACAAVVTATPAASQSASAQTTPSTPERTAHKLAEDWAYTFGYTIQRLQGSAPRTAASLASRTASQTQAPVTQAPPRTAQPTPVHVAPQRTSQPTPAVTARPQTVAPTLTASTKPTGYILCFVLAALLPLLLFMIEPMFSVEESIWGDPEVYCALTAPILSVLALVPTLIIGLLSYRKTGKLATKRAHHFLILACVFVLLGLVCCISANDKLSSFSVEAYYENESASEIEFANNYVVGAFICFYYAIHHLICFFAARSMQNK